MAQIVPQEYVDTVYGGEITNRLKLWFNNIEFEDAMILVESVSINSRVMNDGSERFSLKDFVSKEVTIVINDVDLETIVSPVRITIGTLVDGNYVDVPMGVFNITDSPTTDGNKTTITMRDNSILLDYPYNAKPLMDLNDGVATKRQILEDIGTTFGVVVNVPTFANENDEVGIYDNTINGRTYVSWLAEQAGMKAIINRLGEIEFIDFSNLYTWNVPWQIVESFKDGLSFNIQRVVYEDAVRKYEAGAGDNKETLYIDSANPYISTQEQIDDIFDLVDGFEINSFSTGKVLGNPAIDPWDLIKITWEGKDYITLANNSLTYSQSIIQTFDTEIGEEARTENVSLKAEATFRRYAKTEIDNMNAEINLLAGEVEGLTDYIKEAGAIGGFLRLNHTPQSNGAINKLSIKGFELRELYPGMAYPSEYIYPGILSFYTLVFDTTPTFDNEPNYVFVNSPIPLQKLGSVYDEILIEANTIKVVQRIGYSGTTAAALSTPIIHELNDVMLPTFDGETYITVEYFNDLIYESKYIIKNELTNNFALQLETSSQFKLSSKSAVLKVNNQGSIVSAELSASPETGSNVDIKADNINLEGLITANENFKVLNDGSIEAKNGKFSGDILLSGGGRVLSDNGLMTQIIVQGYANGWLYGGSIGFTPLGPAISTFDDILPDELVFDFIVPESFVVVEARVMLEHIPARHLFYDTSPAFGNSRNLELFKMTSYNYLNSPHDVISVFSVVGGDQEIMGVFGEGGFTGETSGLSSAVSTDIKNHVSTGQNTFKVKTINPPVPNDGSYFDHAGAITGTLNIIGYTKFDL